MLCFSWRWNLYLQAWKCLVYTVCLVIEKYRNIYNIRTLLMKRIKIHVENSSLCIQRIISSYNIWFLSPRGMCRYCHRCSSSATLAQSEQIYETRRVTYPSDEHNELLMASVYNEKTILDYRRKENDHQLVRNIQSIEEKNAAGTPRQIIRRHTYIPINRDKECRK